MNYRSCTQAWKVWFWWKFKGEGTAFGTAQPHKSNWEKVSVAGGHWAWEEAIVIHRGQVMPSSEIHTEGVCPHPKHNGKLLHIFWAIITPRVRLQLWFNNTWQSWWERAWPQLSAISFFTNINKKVFWNWPEPSLKGTIDRPWDFCLGL